MTSSSAHQLILRELKCPVCMGYMMPPITQCSTGHNVCASCRPRLNYCPTCRNKLLWIRNLSMENLAAAVRYPCVNKMAGCSSSFRLHSIKDHEAECPYRNHTCPYHRISKEDCLWSGPLPEMKSHVQEMHSSPGDNVELAGPFKTVLRNISETSSFRQAVFTLNELFYVIWEVRDKMFYCVSFHIGPKKNSSKFKYRFRVLKERGGESISYSLKMSSFMDDVEEIIKCGDCVAIHYRSVEKFIKNGALPFEIYIFHNDDYKLCGKMKENVVYGDFNGSDNEAADEAENK